MHVAVLGLGAMGSRLAARLLAAGHAVTVWNRSADAAAPLVAQGAAAAASPRAAVAGAGVVIAMLRDDEASRRVWLAAEDGALAGLPAGCIAIESSTLTLAWVGELAAAMAARGVGFLDAPVAGSRPQAEAGQLIHLVGGEAAVLDAARPVLAALGGAIHHAGAVGQGALLKLAVNTLFAVQVAAMAELVALLRHASPDAARLVDLLGATPVCSPAAKGAAASMLAGGFAPMFPVALVEKDLGYFEAAAPGAMPVAQAARARFQEAIAAGLGGLHLTAVARLGHGGLMRSPQRRFAAQGVVAQGSEA